MVRIKTIPKYVEGRKLYSCNYCAIVNECEWVWDDYNKEKTVKQARLKDCLGVK